MFHPICLLEKDVVVVGTSQEAPGEASFSNRKLGPNATYSIHTAFQPSLPQGEHNLGICLMGRILKMENARIWSPKKTQNSHKHTLLFATMFPNMLPLCSLLSKALCCYVEWRDHQILASPKFMHCLCPKARTRFFTAITRKLDFKASSQRHVTTLLP